MRVPEFVGVPKMDVPGFVLVCPDLLIYKTPAIIKQMGVPYVFRVPEMNVPDVVLVCPNLVYL